MKKAIYIILLFLGSNLSCTVVDTELLELVLEIKNQNEELLTEVKSLQTKSDSLINELKNGAAKQEEVLKKVTDLQAELAKVVSQIGKLTEQLTSQDADLEAIKSQLADLQEKYKGILVQLEQLQKLSQILAEIEKLKGQLSELDGKYQVILGSLAQNKEQLDALKNQIGSVQSQLAENLTKISQLTAQLGEQGADIEKILAELEVLKGSCNELVSLLNDLLNNGSGIGNELIDRYPVGSVFCAAGPTEIVDVVNPKTGKTWMDRNLGASRAATSSTDEQAYGDLYQWGRRSDGHQCFDSKTTSVLSSLDQPSHGDFILAVASPYDWRTPQNTNLWQGVNGVNNPCPSGYRLPTDTELNAERLSWGANTSAGAFASPLKLPMAGERNFSSGSLSGTSTIGNYWSSSVFISNSWFMFFNGSTASTGGTFRTYAVSVRCLKD